MSMKSLLTLSLACMSLFSFSQTKVTWGEEFKMHRSSTDFNIIYSDKSGIYLEESHLAARSFGFGFRKSGILVKLDGNMAEAYRNDFDKELRGKEYDRLFLIGDHLYLFATSYEKKENALHLHAAEIDKASGQLKNDWQEVYMWQKNDKKEDIDYNITLSEDGTRIVLTGTITGREQNKYEIKMMDANLKSMGKALNISNEFDPKTFQVQDFIYTSSGNAIVIGRVYAYEEGKKKKDKFLQFTNYSIRIYDAQGKMVKEMATDIDGKYLVTGKMIQVQNDIVLAAFYSNEKKRKEINGMMVQRFDPATGAVKITTKQELSTSMVTQVDEDDDDDKKKKKEEKKDEEDEGLAANLVFRNFYVTPDNALVILAERYSRYFTESSVYMTGTGPNAAGYWRTTTYLNYACDDIYMSRISATGKIDWLHILPKRQFENMAVGRNNGLVGYSYYGFFDRIDNRPFYSGFTSMAGNGKIHLFFNDNDANAAVLQPGGRVKKTVRFGKSSCYQVDLDMTTGKYTRKALFNNNDIPTCMPRLASVMGNTLWVTGKEDRVLAKSKVVVGKFEVGN